MTDLPSGYTLRPAHEADAATIRAMVRAEWLDPTSLDWRHFRVIESGGVIVAIGQVKALPGCFEMGSLVTLPNHRGRGLAAALMAALEAHAPRPLYLLCAARMEPFYRDHGYRTIRWLDAPLFLRLKLLIPLLLRPLGVVVRVMRKDEPVPPER